MEHTTTLADTSRIAGYGPLGHGTWLITCSCGWQRSSITGGRNRADMIRRDHQRLNSHWGVRA